MSNSYYRWSTGSDIPLFLQLGGATGETGKTPQVAIRRIRQLDGTVLDGNYWTGSAFTASPTWLSMSEYDAANAPGLYVYDFAQSGIAVAQIYVMYFRHTSVPIGFAIEQHTITDEIYIPETVPVTPPVIGDTIFGRFDAMEDPIGAVALANADAVWDEPLGDHLTAGSTGAALAAFTTTLTGARQIDITVEDTVAAPIQGATVDIYDATNTFIIGRAYTDVSGQVSIALDDGTYNIRLFASGYTFTVPETLVVTADAAVTYVGTPLYIIVPPASPDKCLIYGTIDNAGGSPIAGACVEAFAETPQVVAGYQKSERVASTLSDGNGFFQLELVRETAILFRITDPEGEIVIESAKTVPDTPTQDLATWG
jgi:hypothetical protein